MPYRMKSKNKNITWKILNIIICKMLYICATSNLWLPPCSFSSHVWISLEKCKILWKFISHLLDCIQHGGLLFEIKFLVCIAIVVLGFSNEIECILCEPSWMIDKEVMWLIIYQVIIMSTLYNLSLLSGEVVRTIWLCDVKVISVCLWFPAEQTGS